MTYTEYTLRLNPHAFNWAILLVLITTFLPFPFAWSIPHASDSERPLLIGATITFALFTLGMVYFLVRTRKRTPESLYLMPTEFGIRYRDGSIRRYALTAYRFERRTISGRRGDSRLLAINPRHDPDKPQEFPCETCAQLDTCGDDDIATCKAYGAYLASSGEPGTVFIPHGREEEFDALFEHLLTAQAALGIRAEEESPDGPAWSYNRASWKESLRRR